MKKFLTVFIFIFWFVSIASAGELITGAFGINLGEPLALDLVKGDIADTFYDRVWNDSKYAEVIPKTHNRLFDTYKVWLTPENKIVVGIFAYANPESCLEPEYQGLEEILKKKYGESFPDEYHLYKIWKDDKGRTIKYACNYNDFAQRSILSILYKGSEEEIDAISIERAKMDLESSDPSGL